MKFFLYFLLVLNIVCSSTKENQTSPAKSSIKSVSEKSYSQLVNTAIQSADKGSYEDIRISYTDTKWYSPYSEPDPIKNMKGLLEEKKYKEVIQITQKNIYEYFAELELHYYSLIAYKELRDEDSFNWHRYVLNRLIDSILKSGDGKSTKSPFTVIAVREEYFFMGILGIEHKGQSLINVDGHAFDMFEVKKNQNFNSDKIYFNIDIPIAGLSKSLGR